jgi:glucose-1-phosphate cytidylyltransferase
MKVVILAGGLGTRLAEETVVRPKPMVEIGGKPILWHIMSLYAAHGFQEFVVAMGYKGEVIRDYFLNYYALTNDLTVDLATGKTRIHGRAEAAWKVHLVDTGDKTQTAGRVGRLRDWLEDATFMLTYGDGLADIDLFELLEFHRSHGKLATVTAVRPPARFGGLCLEGDRVASFTEKPQSGEGWINGGFFVFEPDVLDLIRRDEEVLEIDCMQALMAQDQLMAFRHDGFWQPMDTIREKNYLEELWRSGSAPWKIWGNTAVIGGALRTA